MMSCIKNIKPVLNDLKQMLLNTLEMEDEQWKIVEKKI